MASEICIARTGEKNLDIVYISDLKMLAFGDGTFDKDDRAKFIRLFKHRDFRIIFPNIRLKRGEQKCIRLTAKEVPLL